MNNIASDKEKLANYIAKNVAKMKSKPKSFGDFSNMR
jgi:hypothetical protein